MKWKIYENITVHPPETMPSCVFRHTKRSRIDLQVDAAGNMAPLKEKTHGTIENDVPSTLIGA